jgi:transposase
MCGWMDSMASIVKPVYDLITARVKQSKVIHTDDTRVPVQDEAVKGKCKSGRIWCFLGDQSNPYDVFQYTPDRTRAGPSKWLDTFKGYLQADAYNGYDGIFAGGNVIEVACWAHARRKFFDARETDGRRSAEMLAMVQQLYAVEDEAKQKIAELNASARAASAGLIDAPRRNAP